MKISNGKPLEESKLKLILGMVELNCAVFPVVAGGKKPAVANGVKAASKSLKKIKDFFFANTRANYGIATGSASGFFVVDLDGLEGVTNFQRLEKRYGRCLPTITVRTPHGLHLYFRAPKHRVPNSTSRIVERVDIRGDGGYVVGPGSATPDGVYRFARNRSPDDVEVADAPAWLLKIIGQQLIPETEVENSTKIPEIYRERAAKYAEVARQRELDRLGKAPRHQRNNTLNRCAFKLGQFVPHGLMDHKSVAGQLARVALKIGLNASEIRPTIESGLIAGSRNPRQLSFLKSADEQSPIVPGSETPKQSIAKRLAKLGETDTDNAQRFAERFGGKVIFTLGRGWLVFDGVRYKPDATLQCLELAKKTGRAIRREIEFIESDLARAARARFARESLSKSSLERMLDLAKGLLVVEDSKLDADAMLFNTLSGTIDLRTGRLEKHDSRDLLTKVAPVHGDPNAKCTLFKKVLWRSTGGDRDLMGYLQKCFGYTLTGDISEQALFFAYGPGNTGKSTVVNAFRDMMGDYSAHTPTETLLVKQYDNAIPADLARLDGVRMVTAIEANFNRHLDEARIKGITGGEPITARFMRQNFFEFKPSLKLWLVANDRPRVRHTDAAFWRRVRVLPFSKEVPTNERDLHLPGKLKAEWPGILAWAVRGCLKWQAEALVEPACVRLATGDWQKQVDHVQRFVEETLVFTLDHEVQAASMYESYSRWCRQHGEQRLSQHAFKTRLYEGFDLTHHRVHGRGWWKGVMLKA